MQTDITMKLDLVANLLESKGLIKYAAELDKISDSLEQSSSSKKMIKDLFNRVNHTDFSDEHISENLLDTIHHYIDFAKPSDGALLPAKLRNIYVDDKGSLLGFFESLEKLIHHGYHLGDSDIKFLGLLDKELGAVL